MSPTITPSTPTTTAHAPHAACADEAELLRRLRAGDEDAFEILVREHSPRMYAVARRMLGCSEEAMDIVQEALIAAHRSIGRFEGASRLGTWLHRIVVNSALMRQRTARRRNEVSIHALLPSFATDGHRNVDRPSWTDSAETLLERAEVRDRVHRRIDELPTEYRTVLLLRDIEQLDTTETADILGVSPGAVKTRLHRARMALRELLERDFA